MNTLFVLMALLLAIDAGVWFYTHGFWGGVLCLVSIAVPYFLWRWTR